MAVEVFRNSGWYMQVDMPDMNEILRDIRKLPKISMTSEEVVQILAEERIGFQ